MKSFVAILSVLAATSNALVIKRDDACTPGLYNCLDGQHFQHCTAGKVWSATLICSAGTACTTGISENPFIRAGDSASPPAASPPAASPPAASPPAAVPSKTDSTPPVVSSSAAASVSDSPPPPPVASPPAASVTDSPPPPAASPSSVGQDTTSTVTTSFTSSTTTLATTTATASVSDSPPPPPPPAASLTTVTGQTSTTDSPPPPPAASSSASPTISDSPPPPPSSTDNPGAGTGPIVKEACFKFDSQDPTWTYSMQNPWGSATGTFGDLPDGKLCVPTNNGAGGAMYIGSTPNPGPGNTKLECYFPTTGVANCDNSLVDGYSLSVECTAGDAVIGSSVNLWEEGTCHDPADGGICVNKNAYLDAENKVDAFFQPAGKTKNCIWWACDQDYFFPVTEQVNCKITGTVPKNA